MAKLAKARGPKKTDLRPVDFSKELLRLWKKALEGQKMTYSPYSQFAVGAALEAQSGEIFAGCNVENASYGGTVCAERVAILKAVSSGVKKFRRIAVVVKAPAVAAPCALCLQTMAEFCEPDFEIAIGNERGLLQIYRFDQLLPVSFGPKDLL
jgi:cytidine deaminase